MISRALPWLLGTLAVSAAGAGAVPPLSQSFDRPAPAAAAPPPSSGGLSQPLPPPPSSTSATRSGAKPSVVPDPVGHSLSSSQSTYKISAGDQLEIYVWGDERLQRVLSVLPDGTFAFPLAGTVAAAGKTPNELEAEISGLLSGQYKGVPPQVTVSVRQPSGMQVSVIGKVRSPQTIAPTRYITVLDALALTGGPSDFADVKNIVVLRRVDGKSTVLRTKLGTALKGKASDLSEASNPVLMTGDTVVVP